MHTHSLAVSKLQEFAAHCENVNCLQLGRKSGQVLVTGGNDATVNMWAVGKTEPIISLKGHQSAVECVAFDWNEEVVVAGAAAGTLKLWDLENTKVMKTLTGHRAGCISVDFHPFGEYFASGSLDANLKIWDIRKKNCIVTYKGHTQGIEHVKVSPDGRWVVSGSQDGVVKLWDLRAGKLMKDFQHGGPITSLDFHPNFFQLATGCADRTARIWDLESLQLLHQTPPEATGITVVRFAPDGTQLVTTCRDCVRIYGGEPQPSMESSAAVHWRHFGDLAFNAGQIVACTINGPDVAVWLVDSPCTSDGGVSVQTTAADNQTIAGENGSSIISADSSANHTGRNPAQQCNAEVSVARAEGSASAAGKSKLHTGTTDSLRTKTAVRERGSSPHAAQSTPIDLGAQIRSGHTWLCQAMAQRLATIQRIAALWEAGQVGKALESLASLSDDVAAVDVLSVLVRNDRNPEHAARLAKLLTIDDATNIIPILLRLTQSGRDRHVMIALEVAQLMLQQFAREILLSLSPAPEPNTVPNGEIRKQPSYKEFVALRLVAESLAKQGGITAIKAKLFCKSWERFIGKAAKTDH